MPGSILSSAEQTLLSGLLARGVRFMIVGMSGALLQGARGVTEDIDLWFEATSSRGVASTQPPRPGRSDRQPPAWGRTTWSQQSVAPAGHTPTRFSTSDRRRS